jgi:hypothetical protein
MTYPGNQYDPNNPQGQQPPQYGQQPPPYGAYPQYPQQGAGYGPAYPANQSSGLAVGALVCSIVGTLICLPAVIAGIIMGHVAYNKANRGEAGGKGMAMAAFIVGYAGLLLQVGFLILYFTLWAGASAVSHYSY